MLNLFQVALGIPPSGVRGLILPFFFGFLSAVIGIIPPGLINMTAAKVNHKDVSKFFSLYYLLRLYIEDLIWLLCCVKLVLEYLQP